MLSATLISFVFATALPVFASCKEGACRILVGGDVGIGDDAFAAGFSAVQQNSPPVGVVAPEYIRRAVARRASMNHYVRVDVEADRVGVTTMRVCASGEARWKPADTNVWPGGLSMLECYGKPLGVAVFDHFELRKSP